MLKKPLWVRVLLVVLICLADLLWAAGWIYGWIRAGTMVSVSRASGNLPGILLQNLILSVVPVLLFVLCRLGLKGDFAREMYLTIPGKAQGIGVLALGLILLGICGYALITRADKGTVLYALFYYTFVIAFAEEFVCRDVCTWLLKEEHPALRYLLPNLLFAAMHIFSHADWGSITGAYVVRFVCTELLGLAVLGCGMQALKEKTGTLWIPVLLHAIMDYSMVLRS